MESDLWEPGSYDPHNLGPCLAFDAFSQSEKKHGLVYLECVKDGDSDIEKT